MLCTITDFSMNKRLNTRSDQSVFNRCRIGHSHLTHEFLLKGEPPQECTPCNCPLTIKHLLIECVDFSDVRQRFYGIPSLQDLFKTVKPEVILEFLKAAALYRLLSFVWMGFFLLLSFFFKINVWLFEALTCSRHEDGPSCRHGVKPPLTHSMNKQGWQFLPMNFRKILQKKLNGRINFFHQKSEEMEEIK